jgi:hypothetical protein
MLVVVEADADRLVGFGDRRLPRNFRQCDPWAGGIACTLGDTVDAKRVSASRSVAHSPERSTTCESCTTPNARRAPCLKLANRIAGPLLTLTDFQPIQCADLARWRQSR